MREFFMLYRGSLSLAGLQWGEVGWVQIPRPAAGELVTTIARGSDPQSFWAMVDQQGIPVFPTGQVIPTLPF